MEGMGFGSSLLREGKLDCVVRRSKRASKRAHSFENFVFLLTPVNGHFKNHDVKNLQQSCYERPALLR